MLIKGWSQAVSENGTLVGGLAGEKLVHVRLVITAALSESEGLVSEAIFIS